jgi:hypothetical protein
VDFSHTAQIIYQYIINVLKEYNLKRDLENNFFSIPFDNVSDNIKSIDFFTRSLNSIMDEKKIIKNILIIFFILPLKRVLKHPVLIN